MSEGLPQLDPATAVSVGRVVSPHGVKGDVKVVALSDFPERFQTGARVWLKAVPVRIERSRWQGRNVVLKFEGIDDRTAAESIKEEVLFVPEPAKLLEPDVFYQHDIVGMTAVDLEGEELGKVTDIFSTGSNDVYVIDGERGQLLLPALDDVVKSIDLESKKMTVELMEGLEFQGAPKPSRRRTPKPE